MVTLGKKNKVINCSAPAHVNFYQIHHKVRFYSLTLVLMRGEGVILSSLKKNIFKAKTTPKLAIFYHAKKIIVFISKRRGIESTPPPIKTKVKYLNGASCKYAQSLLPCDSKSGPEK